MKITGIEIDISGGGVKFETNIHAVKTLKKFIQVFACRYLKKRYPRQILDGWCSDGFLNPPSSESRIYFPKSVPNPKLKQKNIISFHGNITAKLRI